jgi:hypothetical protein
MCPIRNCFGRDATLRKLCHHIGDHNLSKAKLHQGRKTIIDAQVVIKKDQSGGRIDFIRCNPVAPFNCCQVHKVVSSVTHSIAFGDPAFFLSTNGLIQGINGKHLGFGSGSPHKACGLTCIYSGFNDCLWFQDLARQPECTCMIDADATHVHISHAHPRTHPNDSGAARACFQQSCVLS